MVVQFRSRISLWIVTQNVDCRDQAQNGKENRLRCWLKRYIRGDGGRYPTYAGEPFQLRNDGLE